MPIFAEALTLVKSVEAHLVSETESEIRLFSYLKRALWFPTKFLHIGISEKIKGASAWALLSFAFMMIGGWPNNSGIANTETAYMLMLVSTITPMFLVVFALPSMYGDSGVSSKAVKFVVDLLHSRGFSCAKDIELLKKSVRPFEERARSRVSALKWLVGLLWASCIYAFSKVIEASMSPTPAFMSYLFLCACLLMVVLAAYLCVWGYEASLDKLFRAIEFGCNDFCFSIELPSTSGTPTRQSTRKLRNKAMQLRSLPR